MDFWESMGWAEAMKKPKSKIIKLKKFDDGEIGFYVEDILGVGRAREAVQYSIKPIGNGGIEITFYDKEGKPLKLS